MLLFQKRFHGGLLDGTITLTFRSWSHARVRPGRRYRCHPIGVIEVLGIEETMPSAITEEDARRAGFEDRGELLGYLKEKSETGSGRTLYRIEIRHAGEEDRVELALDDRLSRNDVEAIRETLSGMDRRSGHGAWTMETLRTIRKRPRTAASKLAEALGREKTSFKADVVKLKRLGLTQSLEVGYELSPRGRAFLRMIRK